MARKAPTLETLRILFARSGNQCSYPSCQHELFESETNTFVGQICHICAAEFSAPRYDPNQTDEFRRSNENLILLCYKHHKLTDDVERFPPKRLLDIKNKHESRQSKSGWTVDDSILQAIEAKEERTWRLIALTNSSLFQELGHLVLEIDTDLSVRELLRSYDEDNQRFNDLLEMIASDYRGLNDEIKKHLLSLGYNTEKWDEIPYFENPFFNRFWEATNIGYLNFPIALRTTAYQIALNYFFAAAKADPSSNKKQQDLEEIRSYFEENFTGQAVAD